MAAYDALRAQMAAAMEEKKKRDLLAQADSMNSIVDPRIRARDLDTANEMSQRFQREAPAMPVEPEKPVRATAKPAPKKAGKSKPIASGGNGAGASAKAVLPPRPELAPGVPVPRDLAEAESYAAQLAGSVDPAVRKSDTRTKAIADALSEHIRQRRLAGEKLSWEP